MQVFASEFSTGNFHSGRIDSLAISEDNNPVIIEYKKVAFSELIYQSLYYLHWITDHKGDFEIAKPLIELSLKNIEGLKIRTVTYNKRKRFHYFDN